MKLAREGAYNGTTFHRVIKLRDHPGRRSAVEGSGQGEAVRHRRARRVESGDQRRAGDARRRGCGAPAGQAGQRRGAVLRLRDGSAVARRQVHDLRPRVGGPRRRAEDLGDAGGRRRDGGRAHRDPSVEIRDTPPPEPEPFADRDGRRTLRSIARCSKPAPGRSPSSSFPTRRPNTSATSCAWRRRRVRRHVVPPRRHAASSSRPALSPAAGR